MRSSIRIPVLALVGALFTLATAVPAASAEGGVAKFFAGNCEEKTCGKGAEPPTLAEEETKSYRQAGGWVPFGVTDFTLNSYPANNTTFAFEPSSKFFAPVGFPAENLKNLRLDVPEGIVTNAQGRTRCSQADFTGKPLGEGAFTPPTCPESSVIGVNIVKTVFPKGGGEYEDRTLEGKVYNLEQGSGEGTTFGVALVDIPGVAVLHTIIRGSVEFRGDYHDYFVINEIPAGLLESRLVFTGTERENEVTKEKEKYSFIRNPTKCTKVGSETTTTLTAEFATEATTTPYLTRVGSTGCAGLSFAPTFGIVPESALSDGPDGITAELNSKIAHPEDGSQDSADLQSITMKMPEGLTINPSSGAGLQACTPKQAGIAAETRAIAIQKLTPIGCPPGARIGTIDLEVPTLPVGSFRGPVYMAQGENAKGEAEPIREPPYAIYLDAESSRYGIRVLLKGTLTPNTETGQLTVTFNENPEAPFNSAVVHVNGGAYAPLANPLVCGETKTQTSFAAFSGKSFPEESPFTTAGCTSSPPPFAPTQSTSTLPPAGGAQSNFTFNLERPEGQQYMKSLRTVLAPGVAGKIPTVPLCTEAQAKADEAEDIGAGCPASSRIGTATVTAGSGEPYALTGNVYLAGPYEKAPYSLVTVVHVKSGPFDLGYETVRSKIEVEPYSGRVTVTSSLPTIRRGIPTRLRSLTVTVDRPNYLLNPTSCAPLSTESTVTSTLGHEALASSPFQVEGCSSLAFSPTFKAASTGQTSKANGASLETTINLPAGGANVKSVFVQLPKQLPSRLTTLQKACLQKTFETNPFSCPAGSSVGGARANTPLLPGKMTGPAYYVSHGGEAFPDLDVLLEDDGVRLILVGKTDIKKGITSTTFATSPDAPVSSLTLNLPTGPNSALAANGNLCTTSLVMPTTITAQNGKVFKQNTNINVVNCGVQIVGQKVVGNDVYLTVRTYSAGRISGSGANLSTVARHLDAATKSASLKVPLSSSGRSKGRPFSVKVRVGFYPKKRGAPTSVAYTTVTFR